MVQYVIFVGLDEALVSPTQLSTYSRVSMSCDIGPEQGRRLSFWFNGFILRILKMEVNASKEKFVSIKDSFQVIKLYRR